jgi:hypothetical protein
VTTVEKGAVTWSCAKVGNMPRELIQGYHVYKDGTRLTGEPVGLPAEGWDQRFESDQIEAGDALLVQVVDRAGNAWPPVTAPQATPTPTPTPTPTATPTPEGTEIPDATVTPDTVITPGAAQLTLELQPGDAVQVVIEQDGMQESCTGGNCGEEGGFASMAPGLLLAYWYTVDSVQGDTVILNQPESYDSAEITLVFHRDQNTIDLQYDASDSYSDENMATTGEDHKTFSGLPLASVADDAWYFALEAPAAAGHLTGDSVTTCTSYDPDAPGCWCNGGLRTSCSTRSTIWADEGTSLYITLSRRP